MADDPSVPNDSRLFRRIPADSNHIVWDNNLECWRISSQAFRNLSKNPPAFSVNLECVLDEMGEAVDAVFPNTDRYGLVALPARLVRQHNQVIEKVPEPDDPSHGHVVGEKRKPLMKAFAAAVQNGDKIEWVLEPSDWPWSSPASAR